MRVLLTMLNMTADGIIKALNFVLCLLTFGNRVHLSVSSQLRGRHCGVLLVKILNKCILSILVY